MSGEIIRAAKMMQSSGGPAGKKKAAPFFLRRKQYYAESLKTCVFQLAKLIFKLFPKLVYTRLFFYGAGEQLGWRIYRKNFSSIILPFFSHD